MIVKALVSWNRYIPGKEMETIRPGKFVEVRDSIGRYMIDVGWAKASRKKMIKG